MQQSRRKTHRSARPLAPLYLRMTGQRGSLEKVQGEGYPYSDVYYGIIPVKEPDLPIVATVEIIWAVPDYREYSDRLALTRGKDQHGKALILGTLSLDSVDLMEPMEVHTGMPGWRMFVEPDGGKRAMLNRHLGRVDDLLGSVAVAHTNTAWHLYEGALLPKLPVAADLPGWDR